jgi:ribosome biogenesis GTPase A
VPHGSFTMIGWGDLRRLLVSVDIVLEVLDARNPMGTRSRRLERMVENMGKELILVLNKSDLVPRSIVEDWARILGGDGYRVVYIAAARHWGTRILRRRILEAAVETPVTVGVVGYPKTGKSSIINALKGRHSASTSPIPGSHGYTRHPQIYRVDDKIMILDTPGVIPVEGSELERIIRGVSPEKLQDPVPPAIMLIKHVLSHVPAAFHAAYGLESRNPMIILEELARRRGWFYKSTGEPLIEEAARTVIRDYHKGRIPFYTRPPQASSVWGRGRS